MVDKGKRVMNIQSKIYQTRYGINNKPIIPRSATYVPVLRANPVSIECMTTWDALFSKSNVNTQNPVCSFVLQLYSGLGG